MSHSNPREEEATIELNCLLEILSGHFVLFAVEVVSADDEPADRMGRVVLDQVMRAVIELPSKA